MIYFFEDRQSISTLPSDLLDHLKSVGVLLNGDNVIKYCGFLSFKSDFYVFFPRNTDPLLFNRENAVYLSKCLLKYYRTKDSHFSDGDQTEFSGSSLLKTLTFLIEDYLENGIYVRKYRRSTINKGRINWNKTISRSNIYYVNGIPLYLDLHGISYEYDSVCVTAQIHSFVMHDIVNKFGDILLFDTSDSFNVLSSNALHISNLQSLIQVLENEMSFVFSDREMLLISTLIKYIKLLYDDSLSGIVVGTRYFQFVWEHMLNQCCFTKEDFSNQFPDAFYLSIHDNCYIKQTGKSLRYDTIISDVNSSRIAILDAKYYSASTVNDSPGWSDIVKQLYYHVAVDSFYQSRRLVTNHFIFPGRNQSFSEVSIAFSNKLMINKSDFEPLDKYSNIFCHYICPFLLIRKYVLNQCLDVDVDILPGIFNT